MNQTKKITALEQEDQAFKPNPKFTEVDESTFRCKPLQLLTHKKALLIIPLLFRKPSTFETNYPIDRPCCILAAVAQDLYHKWLQIRQCNLSQLPLNNAYIKRVKATFNRSRFPTSCHDWDLLVPSHYTSRTKKAVVISSITDPKDFNCLTIEILWFLIKNHDFVVTGTVEIY